MDYLHPVREFILRRCSFVQLHRVDGNQARGAYCRDHLISVRKGYDPSLDASRIVEELSSNGMLDLIAPKEEIKYRTMDSRLNW